ncbi:MAG: alpha/beta fold hydrolase [Parvibaculum sp.]
MVGATIASESIRSEKVIFEGSQGVQLAARLDRPIGPTRAYALFAHCFTCSKDVFAASRIAGALAARGIAVLRFDFTGLGMSEGDFSNTNFSSNVADLIAAANFLRAEYAAPTILIGHSLGGAAVLAAAEAVPEAVAVATIGAPSNAHHVAASFAHDVAKIEEEGEAEVTLAGRPFKIKKQFLEDIEGHTLSVQIGRLKKALIVFHAPLDAQVGIENASDIFLAAKHPKSFVTLDGADHLLSRREDAVYVADILSSWAARYLPRGNPLQVPEEGKIIVEETGEGKFQQWVHTSQSHFFSDEPKSVGGDDTGPTPYELLLAGLGACTSMTMRMYANLKKIEATRFRVTLSHQKMHADDCEACAAEGQQKIGVIEREIEIEGSLSELERQKLLEIADKCPVHRTLEGDIEVLTRLK